MRGELCESFALLPRRPEPWIRITKPSQSRVKKFIRGRGVPTGALSVEGPAKDKLCRAIMVGSHPSKPMVKERRLSDASPRNDGNDVDFLVCPGTIQKGQILLSTKNVAASN